MQASKVMINDIVGVEALHLRGPTAELPSVEIGGNNGAAALNYVTCILLGLMWNNMETCKA
jgi:hypothetical protein